MEADLDDRNFITAIDIYYMVMVGVGLLVSVCVNRELIIMIINTTNNNNNEPHWQ